MTFSQIETEIVEIPENLNEIEGYSKEENWYYFDNGLDSNLSIHVFSLFKADFGLTEYDNLSMVESHADKQGLVHSTYIQLFNGVQVEGSMLVTHGTEFSISKINGDYAKNLDINVTPTIVAEDALLLALESIGAELYAWEDSTMEAFIKLDSENEEATFYPTGSLLIAKNFLLTNTIYALCWKFDILALSPEYKRLHIYIDAHTGEVLQTLNNGMFCNGVVGSGATFYGTQNFDARHQWIINNVFTLKDCDRGGDIHTKKYDGSGAVTWSETVQSNGHGPSPSEGVWGGFETEAVTAHWLAQETFDCFFDDFGRTSFDGTGNRELRIITEADGMVAASDYYPNESDPSYLAFGYHPITGGAMERTDVVGHEWTHLLSDHELLWEGLAEPQAINESISDIFGNYVEEYITGDSYDYLLGEDVNTDRSMSDPTAFGDPDHFDDILWTDPSGMNSGPFNKMFYLLSAGGTHPGSGVSVTAIGIDDAIQIIYRVVEDHYITGSATYSSARTGCINAAKDLYGDCSVQARQVARAFGAIGVGTPIADNAPCASIVSVIPFYPCEEDINEFDIVFTVQYLPSTATVVWTVPSGWTATISGTGNSICTITHVTDASTKTISASVTSVRGSSTDSFVYDFQDCIEEGCPPLCRFGIGSSDDFTGSFFIYPNPTSNTITIESNQAEQLATYKIYSAQGEVVLSGDIKSQSHSVNIDELPIGFYLVNLLSGNTKEFYKLIVQ